MTDRHPRRHPRVTALVGAVAVLVALAALADPGAAQQTTTTVPIAAPPAPSPGANRWAVSPAGTGGGPSSRPYFAYELAPGASVDDAATVWNYGDVEQTFDLYARDAFNTADGSFGLQTAAEQPRELGAWIRLSATKVTVPPRSGVEVPFTLALPADATPGDHAAAVLASRSTVDPAEDGKAVLVDHRVGSRVYLRVPGELDPRLVIEDVSLTYDGSWNPVGAGTATLTYTVRNTGNVRLRGHVALRLSGPFGVATQERTSQAADGLVGDLPEMLPGNSLTRTEQFPDVRPLIRLTGEVTVDPYPASTRAEAGADAEPTSRSASTWAVPWLLVGALVVLAAAAWWRRRRRGGRGTPAATAPPAPLAGVSGSAGGQSGPAARRPDAD